MKMSTSTQTYELSEERSDAQSSRTVVDGIQSIAKFDPGKETDRQALKKWCQIHWSMTFQKCIAKGNAIHYHECCICFSRRHFLKTAGHPELQSASVMRIPTFKDIESADGFYKWLLARLEALYCSGRPCYFPALNRYHFDEADTADFDQEQSELGYLRKRCDLLQEEHRSLKVTIDQLLSESKALLCSTKHWYSSYLSLAEDNQAEPEFGATPRKLTKTVTVDSSEL